ncbi:MAG: imidazole glycerol phosphate synthase subunit HisH [Actinomycetes bacterium]
MLDYGIGNLRSAEKALQHVGAAAHLTADPVEVAEADAVVLPGVGAFGPCRDALARTGLDVVAVDAARTGRPFLGICVGMQLLFEASDESPGAVGLGIFDGMVRRLPDNVKHPQMQWNRLEVRGAGSPLLDGLGDQPWMYFVHSFASEVTDDVVATCNYGGPVAAMAARGNVVATQFHPEKSGRVGLEMLRNWVTSIPASGQNGVR